MNRKASKSRTKGELLEENLNLRARIEEAEEALRAIREEGMDLLRMQREAPVQSELRSSEFERDLEKRVCERTAELLKTVDQLNEEISRRQSVEEELQARANQLSRMALQLTIAEEQERRRITEILHDNVQQLLVGAKLRVAGLKRNPEKVQQAVVELDEILGQSIELTRSLTSELSPPILHKGGFVPALEWLAHWMKERHGLEVNLKLDRSSFSIESEDIGILLFQAVRELLLNVVKHAGVSRAHVSVDTVQEMVRIQVSDSGVGFDPAKVQTQSDRFGLFSIRERLNSLGCHVQAESAPGKGASITLLVPLQKPAGPQREQLQAASRKPRPIRILVVDDHAIMRQGLTHMLKAQPDMDVVAEASDGQSAVKMARQFLPDVIVMDMSMPVMSGSEATRIIHSEMPDIQVIGLSMFERRRSEPKP